MQDQRSCRVTAGGQVRNPKIWYFLSWQPSKIFKYWHQQLKLLIILIPIGDINTEVTELQLNYVSKRAHLVFSRHFDIWQRIFIIFADVHYRKFAIMMYNNPPIAFYVIAVPCRILMAIIAMFFTAINVTFILAIYLSIFFQILQFL